MRFFALSLFASFAAGNCVTDGCPEGLHGAGLCCATSGWCGDTLDHCLRSRVCHSGCTPETPSICGDGHCNAAEDCESCPQDCPLLDCAPLETYKYGGELFTEVEKAECDVDTFKNETTNMIEVPESCYKPGGCRLDNGYLMDEAKCIETVVWECVEDGTVALTFDDGPAVNKTARLLDVLEEENVNATFFVNGYKWEGWRNASGALVKRAFDAGHTIASHTFNHVGMSGLNWQQIQEQMMMNEDVIAAEIGMIPKLFRPPYGDTNVRMIQKLNDMGYHTVIWSLDTRDWAFKPGGADSSCGSCHNKTNAKFIKEQLEHDLADSASRSYINLQHDVNDHSTDPEGVRAVIQEVRSKGYRTVTMAECMGWDAEDAYRPARTTHCAADAGWADTAEGITAFLPCAEGENGAKNRFCGTAGWGDIQDGCYGNLCADLGCHALHSVGCDASVTDSPQCICQEPYTGPTCSVCEVGTGDTMVWDEFECAAVMDMDSSTGEDMDSMDSSTGEDMDSMDSSTGEEMEEPTAAAPTTVSASVSVTPLCSVAAMMLLAAW